ncbi:MAG TPA: ABC transporter permease [Firmicutes bacterium]|nr:ABC transporter permease [Bacillota bacterium]
MIGTGRPGDAAIRETTQAVRGTPGVLKWSGTAILLAFYAGMIIFFSVVSPYFLNVRNFLNIGTNMAYIGIMAAGSTLVLIAGGLDLSVEAVAAISGVIIGIIYRAGLGIWTGVIVSIILGTLVGAANGLCVTRLKINAFITTLGSMSIVRGIAFVLTGGLTSSLLHPGFRFIAMGDVAGIPFPLLMMAVVFALAFIVLNYMPFGRSIYAIGGNAEAARLSGINIDLITMLVYVISGAAAAGSGVLLTSMLGASAPQAATGVALTVIAAVILGGTSLSGGKGSIWGTLLGTLILGTLNNGLVLLNVSSFYQDVARGAVLLLAVALDRLRERGAV